MRIVVKSRRTEKGIILLEFDNGETKEYRAIRGGISWPVMAENLPGYYCILGEQYSRWTDRGKLILLREHEATDILTSLTTFFAKLTDDAKLYLCETFYAVIGELQGEDNRGYAEALQNSIYEKQTAGSLEDAPWADRPDLGLYHIKSWMGKGLLELPEGSLVREQLKMVETDKVKRLPETLNAVNALRFVVCGFEKYKPSKPSQKDWRDRVPKGGTGRFSTQGNIRGGYGR
jgi:hypothetical protein